MGNNILFFITLSVVLLILLHNLSYRENFNQEININEAISRQNQLSRGYDPYILDDRKPISDEPNDLMIGVNTSYTPPEIPYVNPSQNIWLNEHNRIRSNVGQTNIKWNDSIANGATKYAEQLAKNGSCSLSHSNIVDRKFGSILLGENLSYGSPSSKYNDKEMVKLWESEKMKYNYPGTPQSIPGVGHYTQIINKNVKEIGCGCANCGKGRICVCRYNPIQSGNRPPY